MALEAIRLVNLAIEKEAARKELVQRAKFLAKLAEKKEITRKELALEAIELAKVATKKEVAVSQLKKMTELTVGREVKMVELKEKIKNLESKQG